MALLKFKLEISVTQHFAQAVDVRLFASRLSSKADEPSLNDTPASNSH